jgi:hypothetical protein
MIGHNGTRLLHGAQNGSGAAVSSAAGRRCGQWRGASGFLMQGDRYMRDKLQAGLTEGR